VPGVRDALGKLRALVAMYQDFEFYLRPIIQDLENVGSDGGPLGEVIPADEGNRLPRLEAFGEEVIGWEPPQEGS
jgi:hypothetical protein